MPDIETIPFWLKVVVLVVAAGLLVMAITGMTHEDNRR